jgi:DNA modification methylase
MKPYYEHAGITIYHGDCREILPSLPKCDLLLTDPPYGINRAGMRASTSAHGGRKAYEALSNWDDSAPDGETFALLFNSAREYVIWGANYFPQNLPPSMGWFVWDKGQRIAQSDGELACTSRTGALRIFELNRVALMLDGAEHPTQKPLALFKWCMAFFPDAQTILDPFMGSGTTLVAAKNLGRKAIGIEIEEKYCEIAAKRLSQEVFDFDH